MTTTDVDAIVLSEAQRRYIRAVAACDGEYHARHGVTANWALRHGVVDTVVHFADGRYVNWHEVEKPFEGDFEIGGQVLTALGRELALRHRLEGACDE